MAGEDGRIGQHDLASGKPVDFGHGGAARVPLPKLGDRRHAYWERQIHACVGVLVKKSLMTVDEMRRCIEGLEPEVYAKASYYEKWATALTDLLLERGAFTNSELDEVLGPKHEQQPEKAFDVGTVVRVRRASHHTRWRKPHLRTPGFVHGVCGVVERHVGTFPNPEKLAFGGTTTDKQPLYIVRFDWQSVCDFSTTEPSVDNADAVTCEVYHSWLEAAGERDLSSQREESRRKIEGLGRAALPQQPDCKRPRTEENPLRTAVLVRSGHDHAHADGDGHGGAHEQRSAVEQRAVDTEIPCPAIARALLELLQAKGHVAAEDLRRIVEMIDEANKDRGAVGRRVVARAWMDSAFKERLLQDGNAACAELGISASNPTAPTELVVVEQTLAEHHFIVCTLCSCYPLQLLGMSPDWYKSREYRSRAVREPRAVLSEFGTEVPKEMRVVVHDSTADCRYLVLPQRPRGTEDWSEERLQQLITRDSMIGVTILPDTV